MLKSGRRGLRNDVVRMWHEHRQSRSAASIEAAAGDEEDTAGERLLVDDEGAVEALSPREGELGFRETALLSLEFCMLWFSANYFASACLEYTSVASVTILTSTSSMWTLVFCSVYGVESFSVRKLVGVMASLVGVGLISTVDLSGGSDENRGSFPHKTPGQVAIGDSMALFSAVVYGLYVTVMKRRVGDEDKVDMRLFFGLVGVFNLVLLWPLFFVLHWTKIEPFEMPPTGKVWTVIVANSLSSFVSDMSWAFAMLLTTPLVVTVGLSLSIPLSLIGEMIQYGQYSSFIYWIGAAVVFISFLFINKESREEGRSKAQSEDGGLVGTRLTASPSVPPPQHAPSPGASA
ncbi:vacuolar membrane protein [Ophiocordyceps sinensis CO18]|nr:vacuolar membrane protein [Ophiocordyceps sinensis CO18]